MFKGDILKVMTTEVRLSYIHIDEPYAQDAQSEPKYSATLLLPKADGACYQEIMQAIEAAKQAGIKGPWKGACPPNFAKPIYDGDGLRERSGEPYGEECHGHWVISAKTKWKPDVVHQSNVRCTLPAGSVKSGDYARVIINFYAYDSSGNRGVACSLGNIMITREGEALGSRTSASDDFSDFESAGAAYQNAGYVPPEAPPQYGYQQNYGQPQYNQAPQQNYGQPQYNQAPQQNYGQPQYNQAPQQNYGQPQYNAPPQQGFDPNAYMSGGYGGYGG